MRTRTLVLTLAGVLVGAILLSEASAWWSIRETEGDPLDLAHVSRVDITGAASVIAITAGDAPSYSARISGRRSGWASLWHSSWYSSDCPPAGQMRIDGDTLRVTVPPVRDYFDLSDCQIEVSANLRPDAAVSISQKAAQMRLSGAFSSVAVNSDAGDFALDGHATAISVAGQALRVRLAFESVFGNETVLLAGRMMEAALTFAQPAAISYVVEATASYVDSSLANTPGAKPEIRVKGEMVHVSIR